MTLLDRYRDHRDDPYRGYAPRGRWASRTAAGLTVAAVVVLVVTLALAAVNPSAGQSKDLGHASSLGYASLLVPNAAQPAKYRIGQAESGNGASAAGQRVVMGSNAVPGSAGSARSGAATSRHHVASAARASYRVDALDGHSVRIPR